MNLVLNPNPPLRYDLPLFLNPTNLTELARFRPIDDSEPPANCRGDLMRILSSVIAIAAALACPCFAQDGAPKPAAPDAAPAPKAAEKPTAGWTDANRTPDAIKQAEAILDAAAKAYQAVPTLSESVSLKVDMAEGMSNEEKMETAYAKPGSLRFAMDQASIIATDGMVYFMPKEPKDKFVEQKIEGSVSKTLSAMLPGFAMPTAALAFREGTKTEGAVDALAGPFLQGAKLAGSRSANGIDEVLVANDTGEAVIMFDGKTHLQTGTKASVTPPGAPPGFVVTIKVAVENTVAPELARPITFEKGERTAVKSVSELAGAGGGSEPEMKVKVGDVAPTAKLTMLDGKEVDIAAMKGKVVVLDFWATWCGPCKKGLPLLEEFAVSMKGNDKVAVHPVNVWENVKGDDRTKAVSTFWADKKFTMTTLLDPESKFIEAYGFSGIPAFVIIGLDGKIAALHVGYDANLKDTLTKEVERALAKK